MLSTLYGISLESWLTALAAVLLALALLLFLRSYLGRLVARRWSLLALMIDRTRLYFLLAAALYAGSGLLPLPPAVAELAYKVFLVAVFLQLGLWSVALFDAFLRARQPAPPIPGGAPNADATTLGAVGLLARVVIWVVIGLLALENISGVKATSLVTSLGITGIAVALAVQQILADLFAAVSIALDKPFVVGDTIAVGDLMGTVEKIGLKSVRLRSVEGETLVFSNSDLLQSRLRNFAGQKRRRVLYKLNVAHATPTAVLQTIPGLLKEAISAQPQVTFDHAHFRAFGEYSLVFEVVFYIDAPDFLSYLDTLQAANLAIHARLVGSGIELTVPTQAVRLLAEKSTS